MNYQRLLVFTQSMFLIAIEAVYGKGAKRAVPDKAVLLSHLARKIVVLNHSEKAMLDKLTEHQQASLLFDMEQPLANVLAKMEIAGISVKKRNAARHGKKPTKLLLMS